MESKQPYRSLFWPVLLIGLGVLWLLGSLNLIPALSWGMLGSLWPLILIIIGLDMLFTRRSPWMGGVIALLAVGLIAFLLVGAPALGLKTTPNVITERFTEPIGSAESATVDLDLSLYATTIQPLANSTDLVDASLTHAGQVTFSAAGEKNKTISLGYQHPDMTFSITPDARWDIGLTPDLPLDLKLDGGSGSVTANLAGLNLSNFWMDVGSGAVRLTLPAAPEAYQAGVVGGSGSLHLSLEDGAEADLSLETHSGSVELRVGQDASLQIVASTGSGSVRFLLPEDAGVRFEVVESGSGSVSVSNRFEKISGSEAKEGVWQTAGWETAARRIHIIIEDQGSGSITVR